MVLEKEQKGGGDKYLGRRACLLDILRFKRRANRWDIKTKAALTPSIAVGIL